MNKIVYIDMDQTLCDYAGQYHDFKERYGITFPQSVRGFFSTLKPLPNAVESYLWLHNRSDVDIHILTAPSVKNLHCYSEKAAWVQFFLGDEALSNMIISNNKGLNRGDFLVDDYTEGRGQETFEGKLIQFGSKEFPDWLAVRAFFEQNL